MVDALQGRGYFAEGLHGDLKQIQRDRVMNSFRNGKTDILVATDVAARGIDVDDVEAVFNYDIPQDDEYYVHRIGRTGRAGREGKAFSLVVGKEVYKMRDIQRYCKTRIIPQAIPSLNDITSIKVDKILDQVRETIENQELDDMIDVIEMKLIEEDYTAMDLAAALLKIVVGDENEEIAESSRPARSLDDLDSWGGRGSKDKGRRGRNDASGRGKGRRVKASEKVYDYIAGEGNSMARLFLNIGKAQKVTPGDILGAVAGESNIPGKVVGSIDMYDGYTFVEVPDEYADTVIQSMKNARIKGKGVHAERANGRK